MTGWGIRDQFLRRTVGYGAAFFSDIPKPPHFNLFWSQFFFFIRAYNNPVFGLWVKILYSYRDNLLVNVVIALMIVIGGIGWWVSNDIWINRKRFLSHKHLSLHTRLVLRTTVALVVLGCLGLIFTEHFGLCLLYPSDAADE